MLICLAYVLVFFGVLTFLDGLMILYIMRKNYKEEREEFRNMVLFSVAGLLIVVLGVILL